MVALRQLQDEVPGVTNEATTGLEQPLLEARQRPALDGEGQDQPAQEIAEIVGDDPEEQAHFVGPEPMAGEPGPVGGGLALFDPLLCRPAVVVEADEAFDAARKERADAMVVRTSIITLLHRRQIVDLTVKNRLPAIYFTTESVEGGGLLSYGPSFNDLFHRAATYVDKILKGAKPADLPVEQPTKFELAIDLRTAKALGLTIPPSVLGRADRVIE